MNALASTGLAVETTGLSKSYGDQIALDRVDIQVPEGAVYVLVGANGAGKSTTFKILLNLERPSAGTADGPSLRGPGFRLLLRLPLA